MSDIPRGLGSNNTLESRANLAAVETDKKKQAQLQQQSIEKKRASLDARHRTPVPTLSYLTVSGYLLEKFAATYDVKPLELENSLLLGNKLDYMNEFFKENGSRRVFLFLKKVPY